MMEVLLKLPDAAKGVDGRMRLVDVRRFLNDMIGLNLSREYSRQGMDELIRRGLVDFIIVHGRVFKDHKTKGTKWFGLTPIGFLRMGLID